MALVRILSDALTSRGLIPAGREAFLPDEEAESAIANGLAELIGEAPPPLPEQPPARKGKSPRSGGLEF